eukprot:1255924-Prymnesium_polylepis.1
MPGMLVRAVNEVPVTDACAATRLEPWRFRRYASGRVGLPWVVCRGLTVGLPWVCCGCAVAAWVCRGVPGLPWLPAFAVAAR